MYYFHTGIEIMVHKLKNRVIEMKWCSFCCLNAPLNTNTEVSPPYPLPKRQILILLVGLQEVSMSETLIVSKQKGRY